LDGGAGVKILERAAAPVQVERAVRAPGDVVEDDRLPGRESGAGGEQKDRPVTVLDEELTEGRLHLHGVVELQPLEDPGGEGAVEFVPDVQLGEGVVLGCVGRRGGSGSPPSRMTLRNCPARKGVRRPMG